MLGWRHQEVLEAPMDYHLLDMTELHRWNRNLLRMYWSLILLIVLSQVGGYLVVQRETPGEVNAYLLKYVLLDLATMALTVLVSSLSRRYPRFQDQLMIGCGCYLAGEIVLSSPPDVHGVFVALNIPLLVAMFYFDKRKLLAAAGIMTVFYASDYALDAELHSSVSPNDLIVISTMLLGTTFAGLALIKRGIGLLKSLEKTMSSEQELLVRTVLMDRIAKIDALTDLYNHRAFQEYWTTVIRQYESSPFPIHLALIDIDDFKSVNDRFGHSTGDAVLKRVADCIRRHLGAHDFAARYGGEEFAVLLLETEAEQCAATLERVRASVAALLFEELEGRPVTVSIGWHTYMGEGKEESFNRTDEALYGAKRTGKNRVWHSI